eukprot:gb/GEZN01012416.1/.p1 GENE.gb/GEZN01012416.1/~~gb/GEZN01012416.1/.p1  ORF type:complete len:294 (+),score=5.60 gb/GEZN01012416.1/:104-985(+)
MGVQVEDDEFLHANSAEQEPLIEESERQHRHAKVLAESDDIAKQRRDIKLLSWLLAITLVVTVTEIIIALLANSLSLIGDASHMFADCLSYSVNLYASYVKLKASENHAKSTPARFFIVVELFAGILSGVILAVVVISVLLEAIHRINQRPNHHHVVDAKLMLGFTLFSLLADFLCISLFYVCDASPVHAHSHGGGGSGSSHSHSHGPSSPDNLTKDVNMFAAYIHALSDLACSLTVLVASLIVLIFHTNPAVTDAWASLAVSLFCAAALSILFKQIYAHYQSLPPRRAAADH